MCDVRVSVFGQPDHLRTVQYRLRTLCGVQVILSIVLKQCLKFLCLVM